MAEAVPQPWERDPLSTNFFDGPMGRLSGTHW